MADKSDNKRSSFIEKRIEVKANVGDYSTVTVSVGFGETVEWETSEERRKKLRAINKELTMELYKDLDSFLKANKLRKRATIMTDAPLKSIWNEES